MTTNADSHSHDIDALTDEAISLLRELYEEAGVEKGKMPEVDRGKVRRAVEKSLAGEGDGNGDD